MEVFQELLRDARDGDIIDIQLVPLDEEEQKVEGALKFLEFYAVHAVPYPVCDGKQFIASK
jgi:hypothetical protein